MKFGLWHQVSSSMYRREDLKDRSKDIIVYRSSFDGTFRMACYDEHTPHYCDAANFEEALKMADDLLIHRGIDFVDSKFNILQ